VKKSEKCALLGYYAESSGNFYRRFRTPYRSSIKRPIFCPETSVRNNYYALRNNPEDHSSHLLHGGNLKSRKSKIYLTPFVSSSVW